MFILPESGEFILPGYTHFFISGYASGKVYRLQNNGRLKLVFKSKGINQPTPGWIHDLFFAFRLTKYDQV